MFEIFGFTLALNGNAYTSKPAHHAIEVFLKHYVAPLCTRDNDYRPEALVIEDGRLYDPVNIRRPLDHVSLPHQTDSCAPAPNRNPSNEDARELFGRLAWTSPADRFEAALTEPTHRIAAQARSRNLPDTETLVSAVSDAGSRGDRNRELHSRLVHALAEDYRRAAEEDVDELDAHARAGTACLFEQLDRSMRDTDDRAPFASPLPPAYRYPAVDLVEAMNGERADAVLFVTIHH